MAKANKLLVTAICALIPLAFGEGSLITYNTQEGCNATLVCNQPGNVTWVETDTGQKIEGLRFQASRHSFFSTLSILDVSKNDAGNITCVAEGQNLTIDVKVCHNEYTTQQCISTIEATPSGNCTTDFIRKNCQQACKLCPEPECTEAVLPTLPTTTGIPQTTSDGSQSTTELDSTLSPSTKNTEYDGNNGVSLQAAGFHIVLVLTASFFSMIISVFQNV